MALKVKRVEVTPLAHEGCRIENLLPDHHPTNSVFHCETYDSTSICGYFVPFADYLADTTILPVATSGVLSCKGDLLIGRRSKQMREYPGFFELIPSGGIHTDNDGVEALLEQCGGDCIESHCVDEITPLALVEDPVQRSLDICMVIELKERPELTFCCEEYTGIRWVKHEEFRLLVEAASVVPTSVALFEYWKSL